MPHRHDPRQNRLLAALPPGVLKSLMPHLKPVLLRAGDVLAEAGERPLHAYFPIDSTISLYYRMENDESAETALIGNEGMFSIAIILGGETLPYCATIATTGHAFRMDGLALKQELDRAESLRHILLLYSQALLTQMEQTAGCGRHHTLIQQLCMHLLLVHDGSLSDDIHLTHETIAHMMGVRREGVTKAARKLREDGLIDYRYGHIRIIDRAGLEALPCECYGAIRREFQRLLGY